MLFIQSQVKIIDNSGAKLGKVIKILTPKTLGGRQKGIVGSLLLLSIKKVLALKKVKKGNIYQALFLRSKQIIPRVIGYISFDFNSCLLLNKKLEPIASRINGLVSKEIREKKYSKVISISSGLL
jgi:large subunit ribosomal protein L14